MVKRKNNILVVGGTGFIGFHLVTFLKKKNFNVFVISLNKPKKNRFLKGVKYIQLDITKKNSLKKLNNLNFQHVVNLGGHVDHSNKIKTFKSHYLGVVNLSNFFINKKIKSFIQMGTGGEYGKLASPHKENMDCKMFNLSTYARSKYLATNHLMSLYKQKSFPAIVLRLYQTYGPQQETNRFLPILIKNCIRNKKFNTSYGKQFRDFIFIKDLVFVIYKCINNKNAKGQIINVGFGRPINIKRIILKVIRICKGGKPQFGKIFLREDENMITYPSIKKLKKILNYKPKTSFLDGIAMTIESYKNRI